MTTTDGRRPAQSPARAIVWSFLAATIVGTFLLMLPQATRNEALPWSDALFTAVSALCVTGLVVVDTGTTFTHFGQLVILGLIQIGGLGVMTVSSLLLLTLGKHLSLKECIVVQEGLSLPARQRLILVLRSIIIFTLVTELLGAGLLYLRFADRFSPLTAAYYGIFHSVSAFCNAGFGLFPNNLEGYVGDWVVNWTVSTLIIVGGIGFLTLMDLRQYLAPTGGPRRRLTLHTKLVLAATLLLILGGAGLIYLLEFGNTLAGLAPGTKYLASYFQSVTCRTAGFNTLPVGVMNSATLLVMIVLMFIGGSPGGTAGGIKTSTAGVLVLTFVALVRGRAETGAFGRRFPREAVQKSLAILLVAGTILLAATLVLVLSERQLLPRTGDYFLWLLFEATSAFGTVGLSTGITPFLTVTGKLVLVALMLIGRVGPLTLIFAALQPAGGAGEIKYPEENVVVG